MKASKNGTLVVVKSTSSYTTSAMQRVETESFRIGVASRCNLQGRVLEYLDARWQTKRIVGSHDTVYIVEQVPAECARLVVGEDNLFETLDEVKAALLPYKSAAQATR